MTICAETVQLDAENFSVCAPEQMIQMETMLASKDYFKSHVWPNVSEKLPMTESLLNKIFDMGVVNTHTKARSCKEIYAGWPDQFKNIYHVILHKYGLCNKMYDHFGYDFIPE